MIIFTLIGAWNDYLMPLVFLQSPHLQTITLVPQFFVGEFSNDQTKILASAVITAIPEVVAYAISVVIAHTRSGVKARADGSVRRTCAWGCERSRA